MIGLEFLDVKDHFVFRKHSLERLRDLAEHPVMPLYIRQITFTTDIVPKFRTPDEWESHAHVNRNTEPYAQDQPLLEFNEAFRALAWQHHQELRAEQEVLLKDMQTVCEIIRQSFAKLIRLEVFCIQSLEDREGYAVLKPLFMHEPNQSWYCFNDYCSSETFEIVFPKVLDAFLAGRSLSHRLINTSIPLGCLEIISRSFVHFNQETLRLLWAQPTILQSFQIIRVYCFGRTRRVFGNNHITLTIDETFLHQLLANSPNLVYLDVFSLDDIKTNIQTIFEDRSWPNLVDLSLTNVHTGITAFQKFLSAHAESLKYVLLGNTYLKADDGQQQHLWLNMLEFVKSILNLEEIVLRERLTEEEGLVFNIIALKPVCPGTKINVVDIARYLIYGIHPPGWRKDDASVQLLQSLTWADLSLGYQ